MEDLESETPSDPKRSWITRTVIASMVLLIRSYQILISPMIGPNCRFTPTCSAYAIGAIQKHGILRGSWAATRRISRCHPWNPGGYDPP